VAHYSANGTELERWGESGDGDGQFHLGAAQSIAVTPDGSVLVADSWQKRIQRFSPDGKFCEAWSSPGACTGNDDLLRAWDVAADSSGAPTSRHHSAVARVDRLSARRHPGPRVRRDVQRGVHGHHCAAGHDRGRPTGSVDIRLAYGR
jgi:hypothetical protein